MTRRWYAGRGDCSDSGIDTIESGHYYMLHDQIWAASRLRGDGGNLYLRVRPLISSISSGKRRRATTTGGRAQSSETGKVRHGVHLSRADEHPGRA
jgi:hypothetical protein